MASKGQSFSKYTLEFKEEVIEAYKSGKYGGRPQVAKHYNISSGTISTWIIKYRKQGSLENDIEHKRGRPKEKDLTKEDYKERYEILKKYRAFLKEQRERK
jgi:transposase-like protein